MTNSFTRRCNANTTPEIVREIYASQRREEIEIRSRGLDPKNRWKARIAPETLSSEERKLWKEVL